jgi:hypothetical protein
MDFKDDLNNRAMVINDLTETIDKYEKLYTNTMNQKRRNNGTVRTSSRLAANNKNLKKLRNLYEVLPNTKTYIDALKAEHKQKKEELIHILLAHRGDMQELLKDKELSKAVGRIIRPKMRKMESAHYNLSAMNTNAGGGGWGGEATAEENALANLMKGVKFRKTRKQRGGAKGFLQFLLSILAASMVIVDTPTVKKVLNKPATHSLTSYRDPVGELASEVVPAGGTSTEVFVGEHIPTNRVAGRTFVLPDPTFDAGMGELHNELMSFLTPKEYKELMAIIRAAHESGLDVNAAMMKYFTTIGKANM